MRYISKDDYQIVAQDVTLLSYYVQAIGLILGSLITTLGSKRKRDERNIFMLYVIYTGLSTYCYLFDNIFIQLMHCYLIDSVIGLLIVIFQVR